MFEPLQYIISLYRETLIGIFTKLKNKINRKSLSEESLGKIDYLFREYKNTISTINNCEGDKKEEKIMMLNIIDKMLTEINI